ncbi:hypothetical protein QM806_41110, partial [Rhodococcus sp. IEGM 1351]|uniref:hypothetical protein n=1 Tax=Rhodococcus sp. IEGM 1351 TaxID=3047089 RepID=UPI0024B80456
YLLSADVLAQRRKSVYPCIRESVDADEADCMGDAIPCRAVVQSHLTDCSTIPLPAFSTEIRCMLEVAVARHPEIRKAVYAETRASVHRAGHGRATSLHGGFHAGQIHASP